MEAVRASGKVTDYARLLELEMLRARYQYRVSRFFRRQRPLQRFLSHSGPLLVRAPPFSPMDKKVLVIGSGHVSGPVLQYLAEKTGYSVALGEPSRARDTRTCSLIPSCLVVGTDKVDEGKALLERLKSNWKRRVSLVKVDVLDAEKLSDTVSKHDLCIRSAFDIGRLIVD